MDAHGALWLPWVIVGSLPPGIGTMFNMRGCDISIDIYRNNSIWDEHKLAFVADGNSICDGT